MTDLIGQTLGNYRILNKINEGGAALVFRAYQDSMERYVAIKVLKTDLMQDDPTFIERFTREARTIAQLQHPHILPVIDFGQTDQFVYLVMVLLEGGSLRGYLKEQGPLSLDQCAFLFAQVASAMDRAHSRGIIHRDIKPENVLMDADGNTYLSDFGIARILESKQSLTATGSVLGTPHYIAPEQAKGEEIDLRADVYSLGVMLYEMAVGQRPFNADTSFGLIFQHISNPPPDPLSLKPDLPPAVGEVLLKALAKSPEDRYQSALELAEAFVSALPQTPVVTMKAEQAAAVRPIGAQEAAPGVPSSVAATPGTASQRLTPQRMTEDNKVEITSFSGDPRANIPTLNGYMHYAIRALEDVAGLQAMDVILRFAGLERTLDNYPPNNLRLSKDYSFQDFANLNHAMIQYYGAAGKDAAIAIGRTYARWMLTDQPFFGIQSLALRIMPTVAAVRLALNRGIENMGKIFEDNGYPLGISLIEKEDFFMVAVRECPCCVGKRSNVPICWIWEALFLEAGQIIKGKNFRVKEIACRAVGDPMCVWRIDKKPQD